jgi:hypothetical protein
VPNKINYLGIGCLLSRRLSRRAEKGFVCCAYERQKIESLMWPISIELKRAQTYVFSCTTPFTCVVSKESLCKILCYANKCYIRVVSKTFASPFSTSGNMTYVIRATSCLRLSCRIKPISTRRNFLNSCQTVSKWPRKPSFSVKGKNFNKAFTLSRHLNFM